MIGYKEPGKLRLADFLIGQMRAEPVSDWEFIDLKWVGETIGFTESDPNVLRCISLDLVALPPKVTENIMAALGLELKHGMSLEAVEAVRGKSEKKKPMGGKDHAHFAIGGHEPYTVICSFAKPGGLSYLTIIRAGDLPELFRR